MLDRSTASVRVDDIRAEVVLPTTDLRADLPSTGEVRQELPS